MNRLFLATSAAAAVLAVAIVGYGLLPVSDPGGQATVMPSTAPTPSPERTRTGSPPPPLMPNGPLAAGTYLMLPFSSPLASLKVTLTVPDGWGGWPPNAVTPAAGPGGPDGGAVALLLVTALYRDPCRADSGGPLIPAGETVRDLVLAFTEVQGYNVGSPKEVTLGGYSGTRIALVMPDKLDFTTCERGEYWIWDSGPPAQGPGNRWSVWILDVEGTRVVILGHDFPGTSATDQIQLQDIVSSIRIEL